MIHSSTFSWYIACSTVILRTRQMKHQNKITMFEKDLIHNSYAEKWTKFQKIFKYAKYELEHS